jgi:hypothetical protein
MYTKNVVFFFLALTALLFTAGCTEPAQDFKSIENLRQDMHDIDRGRYVVVVMGCNDCHTPDYIIKRGNIPEEDWLVGSSLGFKGPNGTSYPTNLRLLLNTLPEEAWMDIATRMRKESPMADVMLPQAADFDLRAIYRYLRYLGPKGTDAPSRLPEGVTPQTQYILYPDPH